MQTLERMRCQLCLKQHRRESAYCSDEHEERARRPREFELVSLVPAAAPDPPKLVVEAEPPPRQKGGACNQCGKRVPAAHRFYCSKTCSRRAFEVRAERTRFKAPDK
jgi:hypothetical protein